MQTNQMVVLDTSRSTKIAKAFQNRTKNLENFSTKFSGTWQTSMDIFFSLLCPAREADWIPGWQAEILHSTANGYVANKCIWRTDKKNPAGEGIWMIIDYKWGAYLEFVKFHPDFILNVKITASYNHDGTVTGTWNPNCYALTPAGNKWVSKISKAVETEAKVLPKIIEHYLKTGKKSSKLSLALGLAGDAISNHFS